MNKHNSLRVGSMALMSGFLGALASCLGKIALDTSRTSPLNRLQEELFANNKTAPAAEYAVRGIFFVAMLVCNACMLGAFLDGMEQAGSVAGTALSNAANFMSSAVIGYVVWHERFTTSWYIGFAFILTGTILLTIAGSERGPIITHVQDKND
jgi:drug/metabolite transporter (DMT)-like permease